MHLTTIITMSTLIVLGWAAPVVDLSTQEPGTTQIQDVTTQEAVTTSEQPATSPLPETTSIEPAPITSETPTTTSEQPSTTGTPAMTTTQEVPTTTESVTSTEAKTTTAIPGPSTPQQANATTTQAPTYCTPSDVPAVPGWITACGCLQGFNTGVLAADSVASCTVLCLRNLGVLCRSVEWSERAGRGRCVYSTEDRYSRPQSYSSPCYLDSTIQTATVYAEPHFARSQMPDNKVWSNRPIA